MKKMAFMLLPLIIASTMLSCTSKAPPKEFVPDFAQAKMICELASTECYYRNVAKFTHEDRQRFLWMKKDAHFWIEYSGKVVIGIDASKLKIEVDDLNITVTLPQAEILSVSLIDFDNANYIIAKNSAKVTVEDEVHTISEAQSEMELSAKNNALLLSTARENAKKLIGEYIKNVGIAFGKDYKITWIYADENGNAVEIVTEEAISNEQQ